MFHATNTGGGGTFLTDAPSVSAPRRTGPNDGDQFTLICQTWGDPFGNYNNHIWDRISWNGQTGLLPDTYASTPVVADQYLASAARCPAGDPPIPSGTPPVVTTKAEQQGNRGANTFSNTHSISGAGPRVNALQTVNVSCRILDPSAASISPDGYWYRLADSPWNNQYYAAANTFFNGDPPAGPYTLNTDFSVPDCNGGSTPPPTPALPTFTVMNTSETPPDGVYFRNSPHTADTSRITGLGVYANERVQLQCWANGDNVGAFSDHLWYRVTNVTRPSGSFGSFGTNAGYLNAHYINDGKNANVVDDGVPAC